MRNIQFVFIFFIMQTYCIIGFGQLNKNFTIHVSLVNSELSNATVNENIVNTLSSRIQHYYGINPGINYDDNTNIISIEIPNTLDTTNIDFLLTSIGNFNITEAYDNAVYVEKLFKACSLPLLNGLCKDKFENLDSTLHNQPLLKIFCTYTNNGKFLDRSIMGLCFVKDTSCMNQIISNQNILALFPNDAELIWGNFFLVDKLLPLYITRRFNEESLINNTSIKNVNAELDLNGRYHVNMVLKKNYTQVFKELTKKNMGRQLIFIIDNKVYGAPIVNAVVKNSKSSFFVESDEKKAKAIAALIATQPLEYALKVNYNIMENRP